MRTLPAMLLATAAVTVGYAPCAHPTPFAYAAGPGAEPMPGIRDRPVPPAASRHAIGWNTLQRLAGRDWRDRTSARLLEPSLRQLLGTRYAEFRTALGTPHPLRLEGNALVGEGTVPGTLGYRAAWFAFGRNGRLLASLKAGRYGTSIERFGDPGLLGDPHLLHGWQEWAGIDE